MCRTTEFELVDVDGGILSESATLEVARQGQSIRVRPPGVGECGRRREGARSSHRAHVDISRVQRRLALMLHRVQQHPGRGPRPAAPAPGPSSESRHLWLGFGQGQRRQALVLIPVDEGRARGRSVEAALLMAKTALGRHASQSSLLYLA